VLADVFGCGAALSYFKERRRVLMRARRVAQKAPAEPITARTAVGFSGDVMQPSCACNGRVTKRRRARPRNTSGDFFIWVSISEGIGKNADCQRRRCFSRTTFGLPGEWVTNSVEVFVTETYQSNVDHEAPIRSLLPCIPGHGMTRRSRLLL
jgi:hypothetical protein